MHKSTCKSIMPCYVMQKKMKEKNAKGEKPNPWEKAVHAPLHWLSTTGSHCAVYLFRCRLPQPVALCVLRPYPGWTGQIWEVSVSAAPTSHSDWGLSTCSLRRLSGGSKAPEWLRDIYYYFLFLFFANHRESLICIYYFLCTLFVWLLISRKCFLLFIEDWMLSCWDLS